ncbi:hypothetical protein CRG98_001334 [Punica granatum]|uniref:Uncharacterized protein n=1 Tax=Punica granatum TaxID=22663 RepID=A0A2I0LDI0_PUNGR|nr:hypothetical protein CRG98_001334 [Punica granatum]
MNKIARLHPRKFPKPELGKPKVGRVKIKIIILKSNHQTKQALKDFVLGSGPTKTDSTKHSVSPPSIDRCQSPPKEYKRQPRRDYKERRDESNSRRTSDKTPKKESITAGRKRLFLCEESDNPEATTESGRDESNSRGTRDRTPKRESIPVGLLILLPEDLQPKEILPLRGKHMEDR